ncbi:MAG: CRISPR-associated endonuclease Cas1 [Desulfobacteraceae bacterium 4572_130]|nr:MAG: CRISPR-associated endonuclease Cas1 [Desulfobacteraceae bacterium 4572_130]
MQLFIDKFGSYIHIKEGIFEIKIGDIKKNFSPKKISSLVISNAATISTDAINLAVKNNIDIVFLDKYGKPYGRVWAPGFGSTTAIRRKLLELYTEDNALEIIKKWVSRKIQNQINFLEKLLLKRPKSDDYSNELLKINENIEKIQNIDGSLLENTNSIMAYEGNASKNYLKILAKVIPEQYAFKGRSTRPARDLFNAFLNYGYGVLYSKVEIALIIAGLDPYIGFLHSDNYNKKSLVFDFIEQYRIFVDEPVFYLFSRKKIKEDKHCVKVKNGFLLNEDGKRLLIENLYENFDKIVQYKNKRMKQINMIKADAHSFANYLIGKKRDY